MKKSKHRQPAPHTESFSQFISEPPVSVAIIAFALLALVFALFNFKP